VITSIPSDSELPLHSSFRSEPIIQQLPYTRRHHVEHAHWYLSYLPFFYPKRPHREIEERPARTRLAPSPPRFLGRRGPGRGGAFLLGTFNIQHSTPNIQVQTPGCAGSSPEINLSLFREAARRDDRRVG